MKLHQLTPAEALVSLRSAASGLAAVEAAARLKEYGENRIAGVTGPSLARRLAQSFTHFFALILWVAAALAFFAGVRQGDQGMVTLGWAIVGVIIINGMFSFWQEYRADRAIQALQRLLPPMVKVSRDGAVLQLPAAQLIPGDVVLLEEGDDVPADCRVLEAYDLRVNMATVTGESLPQFRDAEPSSEEDVLHSRNIVLAGTSVLSGEAKVVVFHTGMRTEFGKIAHLTQATGGGPSPLQREIIYLSRLVAVLATAVGVVFFFIGQVLGLGFWENFMFAIGIIVANVPEGLLPTVTLALAMATQRMAARNALIRHLPSVEALGATTVICTDKTGTLTQNKMAVKQICLDAAVCAADGVPPAQVAAHRPYFEAAALCHNLKGAVGEGAQRHVWGDPTEVALVEMAQRYLPDVVLDSRIDELPFDSDRKRLSTLHRTPDGLVLYTKGALETVLPLCMRVHLADGVRALSQEERERLVRAQESMAERGLRVLACAYRTVNAGYAREALEQDLVFTGLVGLEDSPRPEVADALRRCREAGIKVIMVTGDHPRTAVAIAREIGLVQTEHPVVITGPELRRLSGVQLQLALDAPEILFARVGADQKMRVVEALKAKKEIVAVTGDGVNDAPALKMADVGIAMGIAGTDVAKESADMILLDDNFASIVNAVEEGRAVFDNIRKFLTYILTSNIPEIVPYLAYVLFKIPLPLTIIQILAVDLGTDMVPALGLGAERPNPEVMRRPPRPRHERLLSHGLLLRAYLFLGILEAVAAMAAFFFVLKQGGWVYGVPLDIHAPLYIQATTACLSAIIVMQVVNVFLCRDPRLPVWTRGLFSNRLILWGIAVELVLILIIDYTPWGNAIFGTAPIALDVWLYVLPFALGMLVLEEGRKWVVRRVNLR